MLRRQASQHIRGRRGAHGDQCLSEPPPLLGCAEEGLLRGLQCDDLRVHEDLAQLALHESYSSRVSGNVCLDRATTDRGRPRDDGRGVGRRFTRRPLDELPGAGALTAGGWLSGGPSIVRWCGPGQSDHRRSHTAESSLVQGDSSDWREMSGNVRQYRVRSPKRGSGGHRRKGSRMARRTIGHAERRGSCHRSTAMSTSVFLKSTRPLGVR